MMAYSLNKQMFHCILLVLDETRIIFTSKVYINNTLQVLNSVYIIYAAQICSGVTHGRMLNGELYTHIIQKLFFLIFFPELFKN